MILDGQVAICGGKKFGKNGVPGPRTNLLEHHQNEQQAQKLNKYLELKQKKQKEAEEKARLKEAEEREREKS